MTSPSSQYLSQTMTSEELIDLWEKFRKGWYAEHWEPLDCEPYEVTQARKLVLAKKPDQVDE